MKVTALLVCHNGSRWLPRVLAALEALSLQPDDGVAVDTGSEDDSVALVEAALHTRVVPLEPTTTYAAAVRAGLATLPPAEDDEWIWLLHDDAAPDPQCLARLTAAVANSEPEVAVVGPKLREWPSLKRLLEVGVTLSGSGRRETGLEPGEYDQGQHDDADPVLAVNTAGMLVRRTVLEDVGLSDDLALFANDLDFGWRLARLGHRVRVAPEAVMFHVEAAHRGRRDGPLARRARRDERAGAMFTLLANSTRGGLPLRLVRLFVGGLLRALGFLLVRAPGDARDEIAALARVYGHPRRLATARRWRRSEATLAPGTVRPLLAPVWMPWRHGLDLLIDLARTIAQIARESLDRRNASSAHSRSLPTRLVRSPSVWALVVAFLVALVASRDLLRGAPLHGGALWAAPGGVGHWWSTWADSWHWLGQGSAAPGPPYLLPLAAAGTVLFGQPGLVIWLLFCLTVPLAMVGALRFFRRLTSGGWAPVWGAATYALLPVLSGAVSQGRVGTVAGVVLLPWVATAALGLAAADPDRRWRATWRTALLLGLLVAFVPVALLVVVVLLVLARWSGVGGLQRAQLAALVAMPVLFCAPWLTAVVRSPGAVLVEAGRAASVAVHPDVWHLLAGTSGGPGSAPAWLTLGIPFAALFALVRADTRSRVLRCWLVASVAALFVALLARVTVSLPGVPLGFRAWPGFPMLLVLAALLTAVVVAADGIIHVAARASFSWRQPVAAIALVGAVLAPVAGVSWWLAHGTQPPLQRSDRTDVPAYMSELAAVHHDSAAIVLRGGPGVRGRHVVDYRVLRSDHGLLGDDGVLAMTAPSARLTEAVARLVGADSSGTADVLAAHGIAFVFALAPVSPAVAGALDASDGFASASAPDPRTRAWRVVPKVNLSGVDSSGSIVRPWLILVQLLTAASGIVLALPSRKVDR